jgi:hypothetical protein
MILVMTNYPYLRAGRHKIESKGKILYASFGFKDGFIGILEDRKVASIYWKNSRMRSNLLLNSFESFKAYDISFSLLAPFR